MDKVRVSEIAKELATHSKDVVEKAIELGLDVKTANSSLNMEDAEKLMNFMMGAIAAPVPKKKAPDAKPTPVETTTQSSDVETTAPKVEVKAELETKSDSKSETPVVAETVKEVEPKAEVKVEVAAPVVATPDTKTRRKGLTIVKKKKPAPAPEPVRPARAMGMSEQESKALSSYGKMSEEAKAELTAKRKANRHHDASKQEHGQKIDISHGNEGFGDVGYDIEEEQIQLIDYRDEQARIDLQEQLKKEQEEQRARRAAAQKLGGNRPRQNFNQRPGGIRRGGRKRRRRTVEEEAVHVSSIEIAEDIRIYEFAEKINKNIGEVIGVLFNLGMMVTKNDFLGKDEIEILAEEFEVEVHTIDLTDEFNLEKDYNNETSADGKVKEEGTHERAPIVTIMGHVDHGKTSLLDYIRTSRIAAREAGGITQHIGAYSVEKNGKMITFLDTPGHAAFSAMRSRGANITDIIVIVVAADDGVKPQTIESIKHAKDSGATIIVAINKMDKDGANPDLVKGQMAENDLNPSDWGGDVDFIPLSAKTGEGVEDLLTTILDNAEILELKATPDQLGKATVVESTIEKGRGPVATVVVQNGTLRVGSFIVSGASFGRVKQLLNSDKKSVKEVGPSETCVVVGLDRVPASGEVLIETKTDKEAKDYANKRHEHDRHKELSISTKTSLDELSALIAEGNLKALKIILKADVHGSLEAIRSSLETLRNDEVKIQIISSAVGGVTQADVDLAYHSDDVVILGFNVRPTGQVLASAKQKGVEIKTYSIIYEMIDDMTAILSGMMSKVVKEQNTGQAFIKEIFTTPKGVKVAGCMVESGKVVRGGKIRIIREGVVQHVTTVLSLRRFKEEVKDVGKGYECGIMLDNYEDILAGDVFETFIEVEENASL